MRHFLEIDDLSPNELARVLDLAVVPEPPRLLAGKGMALIFEKPSARTRNSMVCLPPLESAFDLSITSTYGVSPANILCLSENVVKFPIHRSRVSACPSTSGTSKPATASVDTFFEPVWDILLDPLTF